MAKRTHLLTPRAKPVVAFSNAEEANKNIEIKLVALERFYECLVPSGPRAITEVTVSSLCGVLPTSLRQFNQWTSAQLPEALATQSPTFKRNAPATLRANTAKQEAAQRLLNAIKATFEANIEKPEPARFAPLRRKQKLAVILREIAESALKAEIKLSSSLQSEVDVLKKRLSALERETKDALEARDNVIAKLKAAEIARGSVTTLKASLK